MFELPSFFCSKKNERKSHKKVCENKDFFHDLMPFEDIKIPELNQYQKPDKALFNIHPQHTWVSIFHQFFNVYNIII